MSFSKSVALILFALSLSPAQSQLPHPYLQTCADDEHIDLPKRKLIDAAAYGTSQTLLGPTPAAALDMFSEEGQAATSTKQIEGLGAMLKAFEARNLHVDHTYLVHQIGTSPGPAICGLISGDDWEALQVKATPEQAYVVISAQLTNNKLAIVVWLVPAANGWKVVSLWANVSTLAEKTSSDLLQMARVQTAAGHRFNAFLLLAAAGQTANRGPNLQLGITQTIDEQRSQTLRPPEIEGQPPFLWKDGEATYTITNIGPQAVAGKLYVMINHEVAPWTNNEQVDGWNKQLLAFFKRRFPEYSSVFAGLVVRASERGTHRGYGTVEEIEPAK